MIRATIFAFLYFLYSAALFAQTCVNSIVPTIDGQDYELNDNGSITDRKRKILWSRCSLGQTWEAGKCLGEPMLITWDEAQVLAKTSTLFSIKDWRLPTIHELSAITELSCQQPAINSKLFPDAPSVSFWTSTEFINDSNLAWQVYFGSGENHSAKKNTPAAVLLIRSAEKNN